MTGRRNSPAELRQRQTAALKHGAQRKRHLALIFEEITADADGIKTLRAREDWKPYVRAAVPVVADTASKKMGGGF